MRSKLRHFPTVAPACRKYPSKAPADIGWLRPAALQRAPPRPRSPQKDLCNDGFCTSASPGQARQSSDVTREPERHPQPMLGQEAPPDLRLSCSRAPARPFQSRSGSGGGGPMPMPLSRYRHRRHDSRFRSGGSSITMRQWKRSLPSLCRPLQNIRRRDHPTDQPQQSALSQWDHSLPEDMIQDA